MTELSGIRVDAVGFVEERMSDKAILFRLIQSRTESGIQSLLAQYDNLRYPAMPFRHDDFVGRFEDMIVQRN